MRHADHQFAHPQRRTAPQDRFQRRHQRFAALDAEPLGPGVAAVEKALEGFGDRQDFQDFLAVGRRQRRTALARLEFLLDPGALGRHLDVHVFDADLAAIGLPQHRDDLAQAGPLPPEHIVEKDFAVEIGLAEAVAAVIEFGIGPALVEAERVEIGFEVAAHPVGSDQLQGADRVGGRPAQGLGIECRSGRAVADRAWSLRPGGPRNSASAAGPSSPISAKNRRQLASTEPGSARKRA